MAIIVLGLFVYRELTRKKKEREYFPEDFKNDDPKQEKSKKH